VRSGSQWLNDSMTCRPSWVPTASASGPPPVAALKAARSSRSSAPSLQLQSRPLHAVALAVKMAHKVKIDPDAVRQADSHDPDQMHDAIAATLGLSAIRQAKPCSPPWSSPSSETEQTPPGASPG
jgi:hypothetical protein